MKKTKNKEMILSFVKTNFIFIILLLMILVVGLIQPDTFFTSRNLMNIIRANAVTGIITFGMGMCIISGCIDLSVSTLVAVTACGIGMLSKVSASGETPVPFAVAVIIILFVGMLSGFITGSVISFFNVPPFIASLGMQLLLKGVALVMTDAKAQAGFSDQLLYAGGGTVMGLPMPILIFIVIMIISYVLLHKTRFGSSIYAVGGNETAAAVAGIDAKKVKIAVFIFSGLLTAIAGIILAGRTQGALPTYGTGYENDAITAAVIGGTSFTGGKGRVIGMVAGILMMGVLMNALTMLRINVNWQQIIKGAVIIFAVIFDQLQQRQKV